ncbi:nuclear transport factor 2 family protein [Amycolatopsis sp.]|uniref:nuclear transport factor 2 family protein n=1 Tax=Amycolatopsis sp. TaxID=37632 RepID=UPI0039C85566
MISVRRTNAYDAASAAALHRDDGTHLDMAIGSSRSGRAARRDGLREFFGTFGDLSWTVKSVHVGKEHHAAVCVMRGWTDATVDHSHRGPYLRVGRARYWSRLAATGV